jgi:exodeoxyribonuclease VII large subunit
VLAFPQTLIDVRADELVRYVARSEELLHRVIERASTRVSELTAQLRALSPESTLRRGYAIAQLPSGAILRDADDAPADTPLVLTLASGTLGATSTGSRRSPSAR